MLTRYACTAAELSCVIGNIFAELSPPCAACGAEVLQITGTTVTGNAATLTVTEAGFDFDGCADDTAMIERMRKGRCVYAKTGAGALENKQPSATPPTVANRNAFTGSDTYKIRQVETGILYEDAVDTLAYHYEETDTLLETEGENEEAEIQDYEAAFGRFGV